MLFPASGHPLGERTKGLVSRPVFRTLNIIVTRQGYAGVLAKSSGYQSKGDRIPAFAFISVHLASNKLKLSFELSPERTHVDGAWDTSSVLIVVLGLA